jgi:hypothetical protein
MAGKVTCSELLMIFLPLIIHACVGLDHFAYPPLAITLSLSCIQPPHARETIFAYHMVPQLPIRMSDGVEPMVIHNIVLKEELYL